MSQSEDKVTVILEEIADNLEEVMDCWEQYLNTETGEVVAISDGTWVETDEELLEEIESSDCYVRLPNQYEIHEYQIMEDFADAVPAGKKQERLFRALNGRKPYRHFKDEIDNLNLDKAYYAYRFLAFCKIAREWCEENEIPYKMREGK